MYCLPGVTQKVLLIYWFLYMGFYCIVYQASDKMSYQSTGSYTRAFTVLSTRCHKKGPTNLQVLMYSFSVYSVPGPNKRSYQSTGFYIWVFTVLSTRCHTKLPKKSTGSYIGVLQYCLQGVIEQVLPMYRFL